jgi:hypothetical protein
MRRITPIPIVIEPKRLFESKAHGKNIDVYKVENSGLRIYATVRNSSIPGAGLGVYLAEPVKKGEIIGRYTGSIESWKDSTTATWRYSKSDFLIMMSYYDSDREFVLDGSKAPQSASDQLKVLGLDPCFHKAPMNPQEWPGMYAHMINHSSYDPNCIILEDGMVQMLKDLPAGQELLWNYGASYWQGKSPFIVGKKRKSRLHYARTHYWERLGGGCLLLLRRSRSPSPQSLLLLRSSRRPTSRSLRRRGTFDIFYCSRKWK